jgi:hypothetical protein
VQVKANNLLVVSVFNPTNKTINFTGHLFEPNGFSPSVDTSGSVAPHASIGRNWECSSADCDATPRFTTSSGKAVYTVRYVDITGTLINIPPGGMKKI